ncbi:MAG: helix-turn-helix transcriptional regulator [Polyangiales bacterium]
MLDASARLLRLLALLGSRRFWTGAELADRLEVTPRTLRRDIDKLRSLGYPVSSSAGVAGGYALAAGPSLPPLMLEEDEAVAVAVGLRSAASGAVVGVEEAALRGLAKLEQVLPPRLRHRVGSLHASVSPLHWTSPGVDAALLTTVASACRDEEIVTFRYRDARGRASERRVEPHGIVNAGSRWYLAGWDLDRDDFRTFRLDRAAGATPMARHFTPRAIPGGDVATYVARSVSTGPYDRHVRVVLHAPYEKIRPRVPPLAARVEPLDEGRCLLEAGGHHLDVVALHIASIGVDFDVLEPPELAQQLHELAGRLARAARSAPAQ